MARSREDLVRWSLKKAEEYMESASVNLRNDRLYPAAEEIFRVIETSLEAMLYHYGIRKIEYPGRKKFTGRLALQFLIRDTLISRTCIRAPQSGLQPRENL
jgi:HEPN domain-containing protein